MTNVIPFPVKPRRISTVRSRNKALSVLVPKLLGTLWTLGQRERGTAAVCGRVKALVGDDLEVGAVIIGPWAYALDIYARAAPDTWTKMFAAHVGTAQRMAFQFKYLNGHCSVLSWKRGTWEDRLVATPTEPRTFAHLLTAGLTRA